MIAQFPESGNSQHTPQDKALRAMLLSRLRRFCLLRVVVTDIVEMRQVDRAIVSTIIDMQRAGIGVIAAQEIGRLVKA